METAETARFQALKDFRKLLRLICPTMERCAGGSGNPNPPRLTGAAGPGTLIGFVLQRGK
jgi:hypothetical protein